MWGRWQQRGPQPPPWPTCFRPDMTVHSFLPAAVPLPCPIIQPGSAQSACTRMHMYKHTHTHVHMHVHEHNVHMHVHIHAYEHSACMHTHVCTHTHGSWLEWVAMLPASSMKMPSGGTRGWQQPKDKVYGAGLQAVISDDTESPKVIGTLEKYHAS